MAPPKRSDNIVVNELLAFVQNKLDVMDVVSLEQICLTSYSDVDIHAAMVFLNDSAEPKRVRLNTRNREACGKKNIRDIFRVFQGEDPDDVPTYVARNLSKLPPVTFDHVDVTTLLKDILLLKADVTDMKRKLEVSEQVSAELRRELTLLRGQNAASATPPAACNVTVRSDDTVQHETSTVSNSASRATAADILRVSDPAAERKCDNNIPPPPLPRPEPALHPDAAPFILGKQKEVPPRKTRRTSRKRPPVPPATQKGKQKARPVAKDQHAASKAIVDEDGYTLVEPRKRRLRRNRNKRGTATAASTSLKAAEPIAQLYVSRLDCNTTPEDIMQHVNKTFKHRQDLQRVPAGLTLEIRQLDYMCAGSFEKISGHRVSYLGAIDPPCNVSQYNTATPVLPTEAQLMRFGSKHCIDFT
ncbi:hypothetical protein NE865_04145 [Phthorimaea operculella]|nr:hypothetical protein NE865_04145 [Phthorimaea operculella]